MVVLSQIAKHRTKSRCRTGCCQNRRNLLDRGWVDHRCWWCYYRPVEARLGRRRNPPKPLGCQTPGLAVSFNVLRVWPDRHTASVISFQKSGATKVCTAVAWAGSIPSWGSSRLVDTLGLTFGPVKVESSMSAAGILACISVMRISSRARRARRAPSC